MRFHLHLVPVIAVFVAVFSACNNSSNQPVNLNGAPFINHGIAADIAAESPGNPTIQTVNEHGEPIVIPWIASIRASYGVLIVNLATGEYEQIHMPWDQPQAQARTTLLGSNNRVYTLVQDHFLELDPITREWTAVLEAAGPSLDGVLSNSLRESPDGYIWAATHADTVHLNAYNMDTGELTHYKNVNIENWLQYPSMISFDENNWVYLAVGPTIPRLVAFNTSNEQTRLLLEEDAERAGYGTPEIREAIDGKIYARMPDGAWHQLSGGQSTSIDGVPPHSVDVVQYRGELPPGWTLESVNMPERYVLATNPEGETIIIEIEYEAMGARIHSLTTGPDNKIYGTTGHPASVWTFKPETGEFQHTRPPYNARWASITSYDDVLFAGTYPFGALVRYDPSEEWTFRQHHEMNPHYIIESRDVLLGDTRSVSTLWRARAISAMPSLGYVLLGGNAFTGHTGSGLLLYNVNTGEYTVLEDKDAVEHQSTLAITALEDGTFVGGTTIRPVIGGVQRAEEAVLYILDPRAAEIIWQETPTSGIHTFRDMITGPDGLVYGIYSLEGNSHLFVFDPAQRKMIHEENVEQYYGRATGDQDPRMLIVGPDDYIYGLFSNAIVRINPGTFEHEMLAEPPVYPRTGIAAIGNRIYFAEQSEVWSFQIPGLD